MWNILWAVALLFLALWVFGFVSHFTLGGFIHVLLVLAVVAVVVRLIAGRRVAA